jgi:hypothetical protein
VTFQVCQESELVFSPPEQFVSTRRGTRVATADANEGAKAVRGTRGLYCVDLPKGKFNPLSPCLARDLKLREKKIESWIAQNPELLFSNPEAAMVIATELAGEPMADMLAVDSQGTLIIIEIKRHGSDRDTVGQLLDYAAHLSSWTYDDFNRRWQESSGSKGRDLFEAFKDYAENPGFDKGQFLKERRLFILASGSDEKLRRIMDWLREKTNLRVDYIPFQFYRHGRELFVEIEKIDVERVSPEAEGKGNWFFNSNETYRPGSWKKMLEESLIAVAGYANSEEMLNRPHAGERVFVYLNGKGIIAVGRVGEDEAFSSGKIFGIRSRNEFNRKVRWEVKLPISQIRQAVSAEEVSKWNYNLPRRSTLCAMSDASVADRIASKLKERAGQS